MLLKTYILKTIQANKNHDKVLAIVDWYNLSESFSEDLFKCDGCGGYESEDERNCAQGRRGVAVDLCESCYADTTSCADCGDNYTDDYCGGGEDPNGDFVCESCSESYFTCDSCDNVRHLDDYGTDGECESCARSGRNCIPDYHEQDRFECRDYKANVFGVELEIYVDDTDDVRDVYEKVKDAGFIGERDGSLDDDHGMEIVGPPMTFQQNKERWLKLLDRIRPDCSGWDAGKEYGMHVNVNRTSLGKLHQGKLIVFIHHNKSLCEKVAGRKEVHWAAYHTKRIKDSMSYESRKYEAIALRDDRRMEVRIFRSTLKPEGFLRNLEFVAAAVEYTRTCSISMLSEYDFIHWLEQPSNRKTYPNLHNTLRPNYRTVRTGRKMMYEAERNRLSLESSLSEVILTPVYEQI